MRRKICNSTGIVFKLSSDVPSIICDHAGEPRPARTIPLWPCRGTAPPERIRCWSVRYAPSLPLLRFPRVFRRLDNVEGLLASVVEGVADAAGVTRVGIFSRIRQGDRYRLRAGLRCLPETNEIEYDERDPLVRWFELHGHLVSRANLAHIAAQNQRPLLRRALDTFGAEVIVPLYARGEIIGWLFFGHRITGLPFDYSDLEGLMILAEHVSTVLENALLYEEVTLQKTLAETLLKSIPPGIVAIDEDGIIRWFNPPAEPISGVKAAEVLNRPVEAVGRKLAAMLRETLEAKANPSAATVDRSEHPPLPFGRNPAPGRPTHSTRCRRRHSRSDGGGKFAAKAGPGRSRRFLDRPGREHVARNSQPTRRDQDFCATFARAIRRSRFPEEFQPDRRSGNRSPRQNHHPDQHLRSSGGIEDETAGYSHAGQSVGSSLRAANFASTAAWRWRQNCHRNLPKILGDESALAEAVAHLVANAAEAVTEQKKPKITLSAKPIREGGRASAVLVTVQDNGHGIAPEMREKVFSPFCTTKARGMGLGLPIVKRTVFDHNGRVDIDTSAAEQPLALRCPRLRTAIKLARAAVDRAVRDAKIRRFRRNLPASFAVDLPHC